MQEKSEKVGKCLRILLFLKKISSKMSILHLYSYLIFNVVTWVNKLRIASFHMTSSYSKLTITSLSFNRAIGQNAFII